MIDVPLTSLSPEGKAYLASLHCPLCGTTIPPGQECPKLRARPHVTPDAWRDALLAVAEMEMGQAWLDSLPIEVWPLVGAWYRDGFSVRQGFDRLLEWMRKQGEKSV